MAERPRQRDVLELAQVGELVVDGEAVRRAPSRAPRRAVPAGSRPGPASPGPGGRRGEKSPTYSALGLVEQVERTVEVALGLAGAEPSRPASDSRFWGRPACSPSSWLRSRCWRGRVQVAALAVDRAAPDVHVGVPRGAPARPWLAASRSASS